MNKEELVSAVAGEAKISKAVAEQVVNSTLGAISKALAAGDKVTLVGFGTFEVRERAAREGRNPQTGETLKIEAKKVPAWNPGKAIRDAVSQ
ncbi:MAG: HU family DNA-binding protein [bacterium]|jgi:DNA-binding protein HU-beta|nr:HU family DNA-binding protein [bacterium]